MFSYNKHSPYEVRACYDNNQLRGMIEEARDLIRQVYEATAQVK